ncbi:MAG TPA: GTP-binding protein [Puia sp.]|jgi:hypothetical protein|nr:GTP-binding protein [Puia sp.]
MIRKGTIVSLHYTMKNGRGQVLEEKRTTYLHGSAAISPRLQSQLEGLTAGRHKRIFLEKGDEGADDDFIFEVTIDAVREARTEELFRGVPFTPTKIHLLSGFLGSGKTTAIGQACRLLSKNGITPAVITNDQGTRLVDGEFFTHLDIPSGQVINGCFCCNYNDLDGCIQSLSGQHRPAVLFAESVGSCTDLVATVLKPLLRQYPECHPTISVFADATLLPSVLSDATTFDSAVRYIYWKQLEEAQVIVVSKTDQTGDQTALRRLMAERYPNKIVLYQDSFNEDHIGRWLQTLDEAAEGAAALPSLDIDYDLYGRGEARLAWLDQQLVIQCAGGEAQTAASSLMHSLYDKISRRGYPIGHLKFLLDGATKISFTTTGSTDPITVRPSNRSTLLVNARVQTNPKTLSRLMLTAIRATEIRQPCTIRVLNESCFQPGYPRPTHRMP